MIALTFKQAKEIIAKLHNWANFGEMDKHASISESFAVLDKAAELYCQSQKAKAIELLYESKLQLEYLDKKFPSTGTTAQVLSEIDTYLIETKKD